MSCIAPGEILEIVERVYGVTRFAMAKPTRRTRSGWPLATEARWVAIGLCRRHTSATYAATARLLGLSWSGQVTLRAEVAFAELVETDDLDRWARMETCELDIDAIHEHRLEGGFEGLYLPEKCKRPSAAKSRTPRPLPVARLKRKRPGTEAPGQLYMSI